MGNPIKTLTSYFKEGSKEDFNKTQQLIHEYEGEIFELKNGIKKAQEELKKVDQITNNKDEEIKQLKIEINRLNTLLEKQSKIIKDLETQSGDLKHDKLILQEENDMLIGKSGNFISKLMHFVSVLNTIPFSSIDECIETINSEIEESITDLGFEIIRNNGNLFNPENHRIVSTKVIDDVHLNNHIAEVVRPGIWFKDKCIIPQDVVVYTIKQ